MREGKRGEGVKEAGSSESLTTPNVRMMVNYTVWAAPYRSFRL